MKTTAKTTSSPGRSSSRSYSLSPARRTRSSSLSASPSRQRLSPRKRSNEVANNNYSSSPPSNRRSSRKIKYYGGVQASNNDSDDDEEESSCIVNNAIPSPRRSPRKLVADAATSSNVASMPAAAANDSSDSDSDSDSDSSEQQQQQQSFQKKRRQHPPWLPSNWTYQVIPRNYASRSASAVSSYYYSPKCGLRFRTKMEVEKFLQCLEVLGGGKKGGDDDDQDDDGQDEMDAYELYNGSFSEAKWKKRSRSVDSGTGGGGRGRRGDDENKRKLPRFQRKREDEGGKKDNNTALLARSTRKNRNVPRRRYCDIEWDSSQDSGSSSASVVRDTVSSRSTGVKPDFAESSSSLARSSSRPKRGAATARSTGVDPDCYIIMKPEFIESSSSSRSFPRPNKRGRGRPKKQVSIGDLGYTFRKKFHEGWFTGKVVKIRPGAANDKDRRCLYDDGDEEDLSLAELKALALLDPTLKKVDSNPPISASSPISASNLPTPANGRGYTKLEAMEIITSFPKQCKGGSDGRERAKAIRGMLAKGWVPIAERNLYKYVEKYEKGIPITSEWHVSTRWKAELKSNPITVQPRSNPKLSRHLADKLDEYLDAGAKNKRWYMFFEKLKKFKSQYGTTEIYARTPGADEPLKNWTNRMRVECRKFASGVTDEKLRVDEMRFALLQSIGFKFDLMVRGSPNPASPTSSAPTRSSARKREIVPDQLVSSTVQSRSNSNLSRDLAEKLDEYLEADEKNKRWYMFFEKLKEFKSQYGTTEILTRTPGADDSLKNWTKHMRLHCRKFVNGEAFENLRIDEMRFALLQSIGFEFDLVRGYPNLASATSTVPASSARKREFVPDEVLSQAPPAFTMPSGKKARVSAAKEPSPEEQEVLLLDSLNDVPLDKTAESTLYSNLQTEDGVGGNDECDSDVNSDEEEEDNEWLHKVASLLTTEKSSKGQKRPPSVPPSRSISSITSTSPPPTWVTAVPDAVTLNQPDVTPSTQLKSIHQASSATSTTLGKSSTGEKKKKRYLADNIFYWICSCDTVNKYRYMECSSCSQDKNAYSKRSLMLEKAEKAVESDGVQLVQEAADYIPAIDRPAIPDKVIAYLLQQKIHGVTFSAFCSNPSNELDDYFYWLCGSCTMKNSYSRSSCTACLQPKSALADDSSLLATARQAAGKSKTVKEAIDLIPEKDRRAIPESILDGLVTCVAIIGKGRSKRRCKAARCAGFDYCVSHCDPLLVQKSRIVAQGSKGGDSSSWCSPTKPDASARGITKIIENLPTFLSGIHGKVVNNLNWSVNCIEDSILCGENKPFPLGLKVRKFFLGYGFHDGRIVKIVRKKLVDKEAKEQRPVLVYRIVYNDGDQEDFLHHEISSLRQVFDQANVSPEASSSVQIPTGTCFELKTGNTVTVVSHKTSQVCRNQEENDRLVVQFADSSKEAEIDLLKFQLAVVRKIFSSDSRRNNLDAPLLEWPRYGHGPENDSSQPDTYDISEGLTLSRQVYKSTSKNDVASSFTSSAIDNPRDARPGVKVRMWDPAECFNHLSYDPYAATVCEFCGVDNNANQVVICDKCHCGFHTYCLRPVMVNIPRGDWLCSACSGSSNSVPFEEYKNGIDQQEMMSFLGLPYQKATRFFREHSEAMDLFKEKSKNAIKQRALSLQIPSKQVIFEVGGIKFIRALENSDWRLPVPLLNKSEWATSLSTIVAAMKYCGVGKYSPDLLYPPIGHATEEMNNPELDVDKIHPMSKRNMEIFKAFNHNIKHGVFPPVRVLYDENMGFSVEALAPIQKYTLVGEYVGDVVTVDRSGTSNSDSLMLLLQTEDPETSLIIDPTVSGNYSRFFSGINNRNLLSKRKANVRTRRFAMDGKIHVALFTSRDVEAGEILSYDYNAGNHGKCVEEWAKAGFYDTSNFF